MKTNTALATTQQNAISEKIVKKSVGKMDTCTYMFNHLPDHCFTIKDSTEHNSVNEFLVRRKVICEINKKHFPVGFAHPRKIYPASFAGQVEDSDVEYVMRTDDKNGQITITITFECLSSYHGAKRDDNREFVKRTVMNKWKKLTDADFSREAREIVERFIRTRVDELNEIELKQLSDWLAITAMGQSLDNLRNDEDMKLLRNLKGDLLKSLEQVEARIQAKCHEDIAMRFDNDTRPLSYEGRMIVAKTISSVNPGIQLKN